MYSFIQCNCFSSLYLISQYVTVPCNGLGYSLPCAVASGIGSRRPGPGIGQVGIENRWMGRYFTDNFLKLLCPLAKQQFVKCESALAPCNYISLIKTKPDKQCCSNNMLFQCSNQSLNMRLHFNPTSRPRRIC